MRKVQKAHDLRLEATESDIKESQGRMDTILGMLNARSSSPQVAGDMPSTVTHVFDDTAARDEGSPAPTQVYNIEPASTNDSRSISSLSPDEQVTPVSYATELTSQYLPR